MTQSPSLTVYPEDDFDSSPAGSGIDLGGANYGLQVLKSKFLDMAEARIKTAPFGDKHGIMTEGVTQRSKVLQIQVRVVGDADGTDSNAVMDKERKLDRIKRILDPLRGNLWFKFDLHTGLASDLRRMVLGRLNGPIDSTYVGNITKEFMLSILVPSGTWSSPNLVERSAVTINSDPFNVVEPVSGVAPGTTLSRRNAWINLVQTTGGDITDFTVENTAVDFDGNRVTTGVLTFSQAIPNNTIIRIDLERNHIQFKSGGTGDFVSFMSALSVTSSFPPFVGGVINTWIITGISSGTFAYQYLPEFL